MQAHIEPAVTSLSKAFQFVFHKVLYTHPCSYWNRDVYTQTSSLLESLFQSYGNQLEIDESIFNYFLMGYNSYCQLGAAHPHRYFLSYLPLHPAPQWLSATGLLHFLFHFCLIHRIYLFSAGANLLLKLPRLPKSLLSFQKSEAARPFVE